MVVEVCEGRGQSKLLKHQKPGERGFYEARGERRELTLQE